MLGDSQLARDLEAKEATRQRSIETARTMHGCESDDLQIDDDATVVEVDEGVWVSAVVWVPNRESVIADRDDDNTTGLDITEVMDPHE
jgi:hypothetical protein